MGNLLLLPVITSFMILLSWIFFIYSSYKKKKLSIVYGLLSVIYILHALFLCINQLPFGWYVGFSILWIIFHHIYRKSENISTEGDISKKEEETHE